MAGGEGRWHKGLRATTPATQRAHRRPPHHGLAPHTAGMEGVEGEEGAGQTPPRCGREGGGGAAMPACRARSHQHPRRAGASSIRHDGADGGRCGAGWSVPVAGHVRAQLPPTPRPHSSRLAGRCSPPRRTRASRGKAASPRTSSRRPPGALRTPWRRRQREGDGEAAAATALPRAPLSPLGPLSLTAAAGAWSARSARRRRCGAPLARVCVWGGGVGLGAGPLECAGTRAIRGGQRQCRRAGPPARHT